MGFTPVTKCVWNVQMFPSGNWEPIRCNTSSPRGGLNVLSGPIHKITNKHTHTAPPSRPRAGNVAQSPADGQSPRPLPELRGLGAGLGGRVLEAEGSHCPQELCTLLAQLGSCSVPHILLEMERKSSENCGILGANGLQVSKGSAAKDKGERCQSQRKRRGGI